MSDSIRELIREPMNEFIREPMNEFIREPMNEFIRECTLLHSYRLRFHS